MKEILLIGGGGHCRSCIDVIELGSQFKIAGIVDKPENIGAKVCDYPILYSDKDLDVFANKFSYFLITIGQIKSPDTRIKLFNDLVERGGNFPTIISPRAYVSKRAKIGQGTIILHDALINTEAEIGDNCIINTKALIEHDAVVGNHCHISTSSVLNGGVRVGDETFIGSNSVVREMISIDKRSVVPAGSIVMKNNNNGD